MVTVKATNQVSQLWGDDPRLPVPGDCENVRIRRAIVVYFEPFSDRAEGRFFTRIYYRDFKTSVTRAKVEQFEKDVLNLYQDDEYPGVASAGDLAEEFPKYYSADISNIRFGRQPCHVSYLMSDRQSEFFDGDGSKFTVPMIFRKDKIISKTSLSGEKITFIAEFEPNFSFYRLKVFNQPFPEIFPNAKSIRVLNYMRMGPEGGFLDEDDTTGASRLDYAVDLPVIVEQGRLLKTFNNYFPLEVRTSAEESKFGKDESVMRSQRADRFRSNVLDHVVIVFDPPQSNGGNTGPP